VNAEVFPLHFAADAVLRATPEQAFEFLDDFENLGAHMMRSSLMMAGSSMNYRFDAAHGRGRDARVTLRGSMLGLGLEIEEIVVDYAPPRAKTWRTIGTPRMVLISAYRMGFELAPHPTGARLRVFIDYALPARGLAHWIGRLLAGPYARWCVRSMVSAARATYADPPLTSAPPHRDEAQHARH